MNEKVKEFLEAKKEAEKKKYEREKQQTLIKLGLFEKEYAPLVGYGHIESDNKVVKFPLKNIATKVGDKINISIDGKKVNIRIDKIQYDKTDEFPFFDWDSSISANKYYKKVPIEITNEEYEEVKKYYKPQEEKEDVKITIFKKNTIAAILRVIGIIVYIAGALASIPLGVDEYGDPSAMLLVWWCAFFLCGTFYLGFAEIIQLLEDIKNK